MPCVMSRSGEIVPVLDRNRRACLGQQHYVARPLAVAAIAEPSHALFQIDQIGSRMVRQITMHWNKMSLIEDVEPPRRRPMRHGSADKDEVDSSLALRNRMAAAILRVKRTSSAHHILLEAWRPAPVAGLPAGAAGRAV